MKKLILLTLALTFLLILSQQALASKDYNLTNCEKPRYSWGTSWFCVYETHGSIFLPEPGVGPNAYPTHKVVLEGFTGYEPERQAGLSCYVDLWNPEGTTLKKLGLSPQKGKSEWFHKWLKTSNIYSTWHHLLTETIYHQRWMHEDNPLWEAYGCPYVFYEDFYEDNNHYGHAQLSFYPYHKN